MPPTQYQFPGTHSGIEVEVVKLVGNSSPLYRARQEGQSDVLYESTTLTDMRRFIDAYSAPPARMGVWKVRGYYSLLTHHYTLQDATVAIDGPPHDAVRLAIESQLSQLTEHDWERAKKFAFYIEMA